MTCVSAGANPALAGMPCGASALGTCTGGACVCPAGSAYALGDCQSCPAFTVPRIYVNADPAVGVDNACCGRTNTRGFGGACRTVTQAYQNLGGSFSEILLTGDAQGNASESETYPIHLGSAVALRGNRTYFRGRSGVPVFSVDLDTTEVLITGVNIGTNSVGQSAGASDGIYVGTTAAGASATARTYDVSVRGVSNGVHLDGGQWESGSNNYITNVANAGVLCRSDRRPSAISRAYGDLTIDMASGFGVLASTNCNINYGVSLSIGARSTSCAPAKNGGYGIYAESNAIVRSVGTNINCMNNDGVSLRSNPALAVNNPTVTIRGSIRHSGCAGAYAEVGRLRIFGTTVSNNHWGVIQRSANSSVDPTQSLVNLNGTDPGSATTIFRNTFSCNNQMEPGACCTAGSCPPGYNVWNNSGLPLDAGNNYWEDSPVSVCNCPSSLTSCACAGAAFGQTAPPNDTSVVNSPPSASVTGRPATTITGAALIATPSGCGLVSP
jgi:hypothetical protein